ncbi:MAG: hypothetical protein ABL888_07475 [Pirellulaceae bacterium]
MTETTTQQSPDSPTPRPKRRWLQFNLRTLLVLTLVVGSGLGWIANERRKNARLQADIEALRKSGCVVLIFSEGPYSGTIVVDGDNNPISDAELRRIKSLTNYLCLNLHNTAITDRGLEHLKGLPRLYSLGLRNTEITDAGLVHLKGLSSLKHLYLHNTAITDAGLAHLKGLTNIKSLYLRGTKVTKSGVAELQKALPNCRIEYNAKD